MLGHIVLGLWRHRNEKDIKIPGDGGGVLYTCTSGGMCTVGAGRGGGALLCTLSREGLWTML